MIASKARKAFTLTEIMLVVALLGFIIAIALPTFFRARELSRQRACQENLQKIYGAKEAFAIETGAAPGSTPDWSDLIGAERYLRKTPVCRAGGDYTLNAIGEDPVCSQESDLQFPHTLDAAPPGGGS